MSGDSLSGGFPHKPVRHLAGVDEPPQRDEELSRKRHDEGLPAASTGTGDALPIPMCQGAVLLELQYPPGELDHGTAHASVTGLGNPLLPSLGPALVRRAGQSDKAGQSASV